MPVTKIRGSRETMITINRRRTVVLVMVVVGTVVVIMVVARTVVVIMVVARTVVVIMAVAGTVIVVMVVAGTKVGIYIFPDYQVFNVHSRRVIVRNCVNILISRGSSEIVLLESRVIVILIEDRLEFFIRED